ncbi:MAG TPA: carbamoyltransferase C-terminal domain-containing protein [Acidobacteriota bacterium]|nr:carbamoyltransferase C-terminal domain-containing protein [Acidobacteriota bacterium]
MYILGLTTMGESAAALLRDGEIVACAEEERFSRQKHHIGFPYHATAYCLSEAGIGIAEVNHVAHYWQPWILRHRVTHTLGILARGYDLFKARVQRGSKQVRGHYLPMFYMPWQVRRDLGRSDFRFHYVEHHVSHAASSFFCSPFDESAILSFDGAGEEATVLFAHGQGSGIKILRRIRLPHSLGQFYSAVTNFLGFDMFAGDEYKVMGMAGWGEPTTSAFLEREVLVRDAPGSFRLDIAFLDHHLAKHRRYSERAIRLWGEARRPDEEVTQRQYDVAASVQKAFEDTLFHLLDWLFHQTNSPNLCIAGGCALNSLANGKITSRTPFEHLYVQPAAHDAGGALGSALFVYHGRLGGPRKSVMRHAYWGPSFDESCCRKAAERARLNPQWLRDQDLFARAAGLIAEGKIIAWFRGRMEWGPRALGNRSFLADPRRSDMKEVINRKIKLREPFRPFAPSILAEASERYFGRTLEAPFMITVFPLLASRREEIPAVVHVDGTARPQLVEREVNPGYWSLIRAFAERTGVPVLLNTSFNVQEPIVCTPEDAVRTFLATEVDYLVMGNLLMPRPAP